MAIAINLMQYLQKYDVPYQVLAHPRTNSSMQTAEAAHIPGNLVAKTVVLEDEQGYLAAVLPATHRIDLGELHRQLNRNLGLATERELEMLFEDCELGAIPPLGAAYGLETIIDESLAEQTDVYFEAGDHEQLIHMSGEAFENLLESAPHTHFSRHI